MALTTVADETELTISPMPRVDRDRFRHFPHTPDTLSHLVLTLDPGTDRVARPLQSPPMAVIDGVVVSVIWRREATSIVDSATSDAVTAARKVASSDSRTLTRDFLALVNGIKESLGYQKNALRCHPPLMPGTLSQFRDDSFFRAAFEARDWWGYIRCRHCCVSPEPFALGETSRRCYIIRIVYS